jgi:hypothetical protein
MIVNNQDEYNRLLNFYQASSTGRVWVIHFTFISFELKLDL